MAVNDIRPYKSPFGGSIEMRYGASTAGEVFDTGEPVAVVDAGTLTEPPDDVSEWLETDGDAEGNIVGIAAWGPAGGAQTNDRPVPIDPRTGVAHTTGGLVGYYPANRGTLFITDNFWIQTTAASAVVPLLTDIGEIYQITYATFGTPDAGWGIEQTAGTIGTDVCARIVDVLDTNGHSVNHALYDGTGVSLVFEITVT